MLNKCNLDDPDGHRILRVSKRMSDDMLVATQEIICGLKRIAAMKGERIFSHFLFLPSFSLSLDSFNSKLFLAFSCQKKVAACNNMLNVCRMFVEGVF